MDAESSQEATTRKCNNCTEKTCLMNIDQILEMKFLPPKTEKTFGKTLYMKIPNPLFIPIINLVRRIKGKPIVRYKSNENGYAIEYGDYVLNTPGPRWINSSRIHFDEKFEIFFKIRPGDTCVDIGACIGDTTLPMVVESGETGKIIAVEPMPENIKYLRINLASYPYASILAKAASDKKGKEKFYLHDTPTGHSLEYDDERNKGVIEVESSTLNDMFKGLKIGFCKIDVQGYETKILKGQDDFFRRVDRLVIETHARYDHDKATYKECLRVMKDQPFEIKFCIKDGVIHCKNIK